MTRRRLNGSDELRAALDEGAEVRLVLVREGLRDDAVVDAARAAGAEIRVVTEAVLRRFSPGAPEDLLGLVGDPLAATLDELMQREGPVWLLAGVAYPGNAGFAIRTAEVSGAAGIVLDSALDGRGRKAALRASMRADWLFPVLWEGAEAALAAAREAGRRVVVLEDAGGAAPWDADLPGAVLVVVGGEHAGVAPELLAAADECVCVPMAGFIPSYNVQAAVAALASELLRRRAKRGNLWGRRSVTLPSEPPLHGGN